MKQPVLNRRIPTFFGLFLLIALVFGTTVLVKTGILFPIRASGSDEPKLVKITNVTDSAFTVTYTTDSPASGSITYGETETYGTVANDERDGSASSQPHTLHSIKIANLKPQTKYVFAIISGSTTYTNNGTPYAITTAPTIAPPSNSKTVTGTISKPNGTKPEEAIVYVSTLGSQTLSTIVAADGSYNLPLDTLRTDTFTEYQTPTDQSPIELQVIGDGLNSTVKITQDKIGSVPPITLGQNYDFTIDVQLDTNTASDSADQGGLPAFDASGPASTNPAILTPQKDQEFSDQQPQFTGTAPPNRTVTIIIHSTQEIHATVTTNKDGLWSYRPTKALTPGTHTIEITTKDEAGLTRTILQSFVVHAEGSQFTEPSVSPVQSPTPTPSPTKAPSPTLRPSATVTPTRTPAISVSPTIIPSPTPTTFPSPTVITTVTPTPIIPTLIPTQVVKPTISPTGSNDVLLTVSFATVAMISGAVLFFVTQGGL